LGARRAATRWLFPVGAARAGVEESVVVLNAGTRPATVSVTGLAGGQALPVDGLQELTLAPGRRQALPIGAHVQRDPLPLLVTSSAPVVVERRLSVVGGPGLSATMGIPLS
ncbi:MAG: hypothetical protein M3Q48_01110, partial [Actinomycetota bacterium]|nr:hypothetical protein [Actinomycetota bacterium]